MHQTQTISLLILLTDKVQNYSKQKSQNDQGRDNQLKPKNKTITKQKCLFLSRKRPPDIGAISAGQGGLSAGGQRHAALHHTAGPDDAPQPQDEDQVDQADLRLP